MDSFEAIIDRFGIGPLSELLGVPDNHVRTMKARDSIPPEYWGALIEATAKDRPITYAGLRALRAKRFRPSASEQAVAS